jgi:hypothetical protein
MTTLLLISTASLAIFAKTGIQKNPTNILNTHGLLLSLKFQLFGKDSDLIIEGDS